jgi:uncharacterized protein YecE (DUF72 family)
MIHVGTSGFSYDDWRGRWYPPALPRARMFDFYAERFAALEINSTYYRIPPARSMESLVRRAAGRVTFTVKFPQEITHRNQLTRGVAALFKDAIAPLHESGRLGALLAQFPQRFHWTPFGARFLEDLWAEFSAYPLVAEIRHATWQRPEPLDFLSSRRISLCLTDMPELPNLPALAPAQSPLTGPLLYLRFHGRNAHQWHLNEYEGARYDYDYSAAEIAPWAAVLNDLAPQATSAFAFFNNHAHGNAPQNANTLLELLGRPPATPGYTDFFSSR